MLTNIVTQPHIIQVKPIIREEEVQTKGENNEIVVSKVPQAQEWFELVKPENGFTHLLVKLFNVEGIADLEAETTHYFVDRANVLAFAEYEETSSDIEA